MRDGRIFEMQQAEGRRAALILGQFQFLQTRQEAFERVVKISRWYDRLWWLLRPLKFIALVDMVQRGLLMEGQRKLAEASTRVHIERPNGSPVC